MILDVTKANLAEIKNPDLRDYAGKYVQIYADFMEQIRQMGLELEPQDITSQVAEQRAELRKKGATLRNNDHSLVLNRISPACQACQTAVGSSTFFLSLKCHRNCFYCFNPNQQDYEYYREHTRDAIAELDGLRASGQQLKHIALTGGEPLLYKEDAIQFFEHARAVFPTAHTRLYTSGDQIDRETLLALQKAGLNEIRFSIRMHDLARGQRHTYERIALAREYIENVMVEMPVLPGTLIEMKEVLLELDRLGIFGVNLLELCFPLNNPQAFREKDYKIKARPFRILYDYWYAGGLPIAGSETVCLDLVDFALDNHLKLGVHYCSLENKHTGQVYQQNRAHSLPKRIFFSQKDYFLKTAKVFGADIPAAKNILEKSGMHDYQFVPQQGYLEFNVDKIRSLKKLGIEVGICWYVIEDREDGPVLRELKVDVTTPQAFQLSKDI